jgi:hypothetical protein
LAVLVSVVPADVVENNAALVVRITPDTDVVDVADTAGPAVVVGVGEQMPHMTGQSS